MVFGDIFEQFLREAPVSVMFRSLMQRALDPDELDDLFERHASSQYTRELLFSSVAGLLSQVVCGVRPSVHSAYVASLGTHPASLSAVYEKLRRVEPEVCRQLVRHTSGRLTQLIEQLGPTLPQPIARYHAKIIDGNHLAPTEHRIKPTRGSNAAPLPGQSLVVLDMATMLVGDVIPCEDAYTSERALVDPVLEKVEAADLWIADRGFCTSRFFLGVGEKGGCFLVRQHRKSVRLEELSDWGPASPVETGSVQEQAIRLIEVEGQGRVMDLRRIRLQLDRPTRSKESELFLLTNLPVEAAAAATLARTYRQRWTLETTFQSLTQALRCEIKTLAYPRAALLGFSLAVVASNLLAVIRAALRCEHGVEAVESRVSNYHLVQEVATTYAGMMIALPPPNWVIFEGLGMEAMAEFLREAAGQTRLARYPRQRHGPKKPRPQRTGRYNDHVSTSRLLSEQKK